MSYRYMICTVGAANKNIDKKYDAASAYVMYTNKKIKEKEVNILKGHSSSYAEYHAIYSAINHCLNSVYTIDIYDDCIITTDSQKVYEMLSYDIASYMIESNDGMLVNKDGIPIKNQDIMKSTLINVMLLGKKTNVLLVYVNSNIPECKMHSYYEDIKKRIDISYEEFLLICEGNKKCIDMIETSFKNIANETDDDVYLYNNEDEEVI